MSGNPPSSPSSSPRLPSPPPMAEDQSGAQSPSLASSELKIRPLESPAQEQAAASRRIRPGTKAVDMAEGPPLVELTEIDSAFQLTEHLKALHFSHTHPVNLPHITLPVTGPVALLLSTPPPTTDRALWLYELCRFLVQRVNTVVIALFADAPPCSAATCPEMRASEWQYLCAVHDPPKACCAIDYCCHTLDWAANVLTNPKHFASRLALGAEHTPPQHQVRQLTNIFRRVYRIFAHAWFSHREMFWRVEGKTGLYIFFKTVCDMYNLLPDDGYTIPAEAEALENEAEPRSPPPQASSNAQDDVATEQAQPAPPPPSILKRPPPTPDTSTAQPPPQPTPINTVLATGATQRRHRQTPSTSASPVETVLEENEEEEHPGEGAQPPQPTEDDEPLSAIQTISPQLPAPQTLQHQTHTTQDPLIQQSHASQPASGAPWHDATVEPQTPQIPAATPAPMAVVDGGDVAEGEGSAAIGDEVPVVAGWREVGPSPHNGGNGDVSVGQIGAALATAAAEDEDVGEETGAP